MKNKFLKVVLCTFLCLTVASTSVFADDNESAKFSFKDFVTGLVEAKVDSYKESVKEKIVDNLYSVGVTFANAALDLKDVGTKIETAFNTVLSNVLDHVDLKDFSSEFDVTVPQSDASGNIVIASISSNYDEKSDKYTGVVALGDSIVSRIKSIKADDGVTWKLNGDTLTLVSDSDVKYVNLEIVVEETDAAGTKTEHTINRKYVIEDNTLINDYYACLDSIYNYKEGSAGSTLVVSEFIDKYSSEEFTIDDYEQMTEEYIEENPDAEATLFANAKVLKNVSFADNAEYLKMFKGIKRVCK